MRKAAACAVVEDGGGQGPGAQSRGGMVHMRAWTASPGAVAHTGRFAIFTHMLETDRLLLSELTPDDAEALYRISHEPGVFQCFTHGPPDSIDAERAGIERHLRHYAEHGFGLYATVLRESGEVIGRCGLLAQQVDGAPEVEVAYLLSPPILGPGPGLRGRGGPSRLRLSFPQSLPSHFNHPSWHFCLQAGCLRHRNDPCPNEPPR